MVGSQGRFLKGRLEVASQPAFSSWGSQGQGRLRIVRAKAIAGRVSSWRRSSFLKTWMDAVVGRERTRIYGKKYKRNRPNQSTFSCVSRGVAGTADHVAARNIRARALVKVPMAG